MKANSMPILLAQHPAHCNLFMSHGLLPIGSLAFHTELILILLPVLDYFSHHFKKSIIAHPISSFSSTNNFVKNLTTPELCIPTANATQPCSEIVIE